MEFPGAGGITGLFIKKKKIEWSRERETTGFVHDTSIEYWEMRKGNGCIESAHLTAAEAGVNVGASDLIAGVRPQAPHSPR